MLFLHTLLGLFVGHGISEFILWCATDLDFFENLGTFKYLKGTKARSRREVRLWKRLPLVSLEAWFSRPKGMKKDIFFLCWSLELSAALIFTLNALQIGSQEQLLFWQVLTILLLMSAFFDLAFKMIPELLLWLLVAYVLGSSLLFSSPLPFGSSAPGAMVVGGLVLALYLATRGKGIGSADIFVAAVIGMLFSWTEGLLVFSLANLLGLVVMIPLILLRGGRRTEQVPLVFFMVLAVYLEHYFLVTNAVFRALGL